MQNNGTGNAAGAYWATLSGLFAALMSIYILADGWWLAAGVAVLLGGMVLATARFGQFSKAARDHVRNAPSTLSLVLAACFATGLLARDVDWSAYLAPMISLLSGVAVYAVMKKNDLYHDPQPA